MRKALIAASLLALAAPAQAQISKDRLCRAIGDTPNVAVPPRDRAFFQDHCDCINGECAYVGGVRHTQLKATVHCEVEARRLIAKRLGRELREEEELGPDFAWSAAIEVLCMKHRSAQRAVKELKAGIVMAKQKDRDENCATDAYVFSHAKSIIDLKARCEGATDASAAEVIIDVKAERERLEVRDEAERQEQAKRDELEEDARVRLRRAMSWNARQWFDYEKREYMQGCQKLYENQDPDRVALYCDCFLQHMQDYGNARVVADAVRANPRYFRDQMAPARSECGEFAGVKPRD